MLGILKRNPVGATLLQLAAEMGCLFSAVLLAVHLHDPGAASAGPLYLSALGFALLVIIISGMLGLYRHDRKLSLRSYVTSMLLALVLIVPLGYGILLVVYTGEHVTDIFGMAVLLAFGSLLVVRHAIVAPLQQAFLRHRVLVLGIGDEAQSVERSFATSRSPNHELVGFYPVKKVQHAMVTRRHLLPDTEPLDRVVERLRVDEIIVAVTEQRGGVLPLRELLDCRLTGVEITGLARFFERAQGRVPIESLKASWLIYGNGFRQNLVRRAVKRTFDIAVSLVFVVSLLPVMLVVALLLALEGQGSIVYRQQRVGLRNKLFVVLKFRTMRADAESDGQPRWAAADDARITRLGRLLRRSRIDELPQLFNVLRGDMSFVGPRPERPHFVSLLTEKIPYYAVRHSIKPGITGWAQVRYTYGASVEDSSKKLEYDLFYVKNNNLSLDLLILFETVRVVLLGEGAR